MRYLGGKHRQSRAIASYVESLGVSFDCYREPFCGALSSAMAVSSVLPGVPVVLSDANKFLMTLWKCGQDGWNPPNSTTESDHAYYKKHRPENDPMTAYMGFAGSFGGQFFGVPARTNGVFHPSYNGTVKKIKWLRENDVSLACTPYWENLSTENDLVYLDPPYIGGHQQSRKQDVPVFDRGHFIQYAESLSGVVITSEFVNEQGWEVVYNWGNTINEGWGKHNSSKRVEELLMRVSSRA